MSLVSDIMGRPAVKITSDANISEAAIKMQHHGVGFLPVVKDGWVAGVITDRDILLRCLAHAGIGFGVTVAHVMTRSFRQCMPDQDIQTAAAIMGDHQVRRLPVCDGMGNLVGVLSVGDIAEHFCEVLAGQTLGEIVESRSAGRSGLHW